MRYNCYSVGNYAKIIPRRAFPNSFDMFNGHTGKYHTIHVLSLLNASYKKYCEASYV